MPKNSNSRTSLVKDQSFSIISPSIYYVKSIFFILLFYRILEYKKCSFNYSSILSQLCRILITKYWNSKNKKKNKHTYKIRDRGFCMYVKNKSKENFYLPAKI